MDVNTNIIFYNINRVANVTIRAFGWKYFQGALPFNHNEKCACGMEVNTHSHMFFECRRTKFLREQADRFASLIYVQKPFKYTIPWNENFFWGDWGTKDPKPPITRCIMLCTLSTMWKAIGTNIRISITENIENFVNAQIAVARNIRNEEGRAKTIAIINKQWKLEKLWLSTTGFPSLKHKTVTYTNGNTLGKDPRRKLPLDDW